MTRQDFERLVEEALRLFAEHPPLQGERGELGKTAHVLECFRGHGREQEDERVVRRQQRRVIEELAGETESLAPAQVHVERRKDDGVENQEFGREDLAAALHMNRVDAAPIASMPLADDGHRFRVECPGPISGRSDLWVYLAEPSADVEQKIVTLVPVLKRRIALLNSCAPDCLST
jgi:hypothetical protein